METRKGTWDQRGETAKTREEETQKPIMDKERLSCRRTRWGWERIIV
jgi:hypothetical protein